MYGGYRGRAGGPSKSTPANVQCQKCLKRERHYSYECKVTPQERPYVPRPSRTQQLLNPKLVPKLSTEVPEEFLKKKKGADEEAAKKKEEETRKQRDLERKTAPSSSRQSPPPPRHRRSPSYDSVSTVSTRSPSPPPRRDAPKAAPRGRARARDLNEPSHAVPGARRRSVTSNEEYYSQRSVSPERNRRRSPSRSLSRSLSRSISRSISRSPVREPHHHQERRRQTSYSEHRRPSPVPRRRHYSESRSRSRSPVRSPARWEDREGRPPVASRYRDRDDHYQPPRRNARLPPRPREPVAPPPARERSLSPFSKRLALTNALRGGR